MWPDSYNNFHFFEEKLEYDISSKQESHISSVLHFFFMHHVLNFSVGSYHIINLCLPSPSLCFPYCVLVFSYFTTKKDVTKWLNTSTSKHNSFLPNWQISLSLFKPTLLEHGTPNARKEAQDEELAIHITPYSLVLRNVDAYFDTWSNVSGGPGKRSVQVTHGFW